MNNVKRIDFDKLLRAALQNNFFNCKGKTYKQIDGVAMGSPLGPTLANAFLCFHEQECYLKEILKKNAFPIKLIDNWIKNFLEDSLRNQSH